MYKIIYKGYNGGRQLSDKSYNLEEARKLKDQFIKAGYPDVLIITVVE